MREEDPAPAAHEPGFRVRLQNVFRKLAACGGQRGERQAESPRKRRPDGRGPRTLLSGQLPDCAPQSFDKRAFIPQRVNAQIVRRYIIDEEEIGIGGYGRVFVAEDREIPGRRVALKKISPHRRAGRESFRREVAVMKTLDHPNICKLLETYEDERSRFLVMEYCDGGDLFECINRDGRNGVPEAECADIIRQVAGALKYAHARGVAHRDLKPENVCFIKAEDGEQHVKVIDWGLSAYFSVEGKPRPMRSNVGSTSYAAPEVFEGESGSGYDEKCDVWSLGILTFVALTGRFPFVATNAAPNADVGLEAVHTIDWDKAKRSFKDCSLDAFDFFRSLARLKPSERPTAEKLLEHPWLRRKSSVDMHEVFANVRWSSSRTFQASFFAAVVARQLDHQALRELPKVFLELDTDGNGELTLEEVRRGFERVYGNACPELADIERVFSLLDLDGSGTLDYTEFCAAGLGDRIADEAMFLRASFNAFDVLDDDGRIARHEFEAVLSKAGALAADKFVTDQIFREFDSDGDGELDYQDWKNFVAHHVTDGRSRCSTLSPTISRSSSGVSTLAERSFRCE